MDARRANPSERSHQSRSEDVGECRAPVAAWESSSRWCFFLLYGVAVGFLGLMLVAAPLVTPMTLMSFMSSYWFIIGMLPFLHRYESGVVAWTWSILVGVLGAICGILIWQSAIAAAPTVLSILVVILGTQGLVIGIIHMFRVRGSDNLISGLVLGIINVMFGIVLLQTTINIHVLPQVFGPLLLLQGIVLIVWTGLVV